jgi:hypothetical protein
MSIIVTKITKKNAFVFSEGRLCFNGSEVDNDFNKTISLFKNTIICAFCGDIVLTNNFSVAGILRKVESDTVTFDFPQFLLDVESAIKYQLSIFLTQNDRSIQLHVVRRICDVDKPFHFIDYLFTANKQNQITVCKVKDENSGNLYRPDGDDTATNFLWTDLGIANYTEDVNTIIKNTEDSIQRAIDDCVTQGKNSCGGTKFHQIL